MERNQILLAEKGGGSDGDRCGYECISILHWYVQQMYAGLWRMLNIVFEWTGCTSPGTLYSDAQGLCRNLLHRFSLYVPKQQLRQTNLWIVRNYLWGLCSRMRQIQGRTLSKMCGHLPTMCGWMQKNDRLSRLIVTTKKCGSGPGYVIDEGGTDKYHFHAFSVPMIRDKGIILRSSFPLDHEPPFGRIDPGDDVTSWPNRADNYQCDKFPFTSTDQGAANGLFSVDCIPSANNAHGRYLAAFTLTNASCTRTPSTLAPIPNDFPPTSGFPTRLSKVLWTLLFRLTGKKLVFEGPFNTIFNTG